MRVPTVRIHHTDYPEGVVINESDFDEDKHELYGSGEKKMTVAEIKEALEAKGIEIPEGAKKAELKALLEKAE